MSSVRLFIVQYITFFILAVTEHTFTYFLTPHFFKDMYTTTETHIYLHFSLF